MLPKTSGPTKIMPSQDASHIVRIAVELENQTPQLIKFDRTQPLTGIIQELCNQWNITDAHNYALKFYEINNKNYYVTEKNRNEVKNGSVLRLHHSPSKTANDILEILRTGKVHDKTPALEKLSTLSSDLTFALEMIKEQGLNLIIAIIESECANDMLKYALLSFVELMEHGTVSWDILEASFITHVVSLTANPVGMPKEVIQAALSVMENIVQNSSNYALVEHNVTFENLIKLLEDSSLHVVQQNTIALINALFMKSNKQRRSSLATLFATKQFRNVLLSNVINLNMGTEITHQLYVLQTLTMGLLQERMLTKMNNQDQDGHEKIKELRRVAFEDAAPDMQNDVTTRRQNNTFSNYYKKLGFKCDINPAQDFIETPPGMLALDCMVYFAKNYQQNYTKVVHENSCRADEHECPFGRTSIELVRVLCEVLHIGETPLEQSQDFHPMLFTHEHPFEEFFCICIIVLNKTWKDMRASNEDFAKVFSVVREQVTRSLKSRPSNLDDFRLKIQTFSYATITSLRQQERASKEECESTASAIVSLKRKIMPEVNELIKAQRLGFLVEGTRFFKYSRGIRSKDKFWYIRLSPNHKVFHYGDCDEKSVPSLEELSNKLMVSDIKQLLVGKECPHTKELKTRKSAMNLGFSITYDNMDQATLDFVAPDEQIINYWTDGVNALLKQPMVSKQRDEDFETLLSMEIKLRLLDTEGVDISNEPPPVPEDPDNYDFCFES